MKERWLPIVGYEGLYEVSNLGKVRSLERKTKAGRRGGKIMKPHIGHFGYAYITLSKPPNTNRKARFLHHLVLEAFVGMRPFGTEACHDPDPDRANCRLNNLRWDTRKNNHADKRKHGTQPRGEKHPMARLSERQVRQIVSMRRTGAPLVILAKKFSVSISLISAIMLGKRWAHI